MSKTLTLGPRQPLPNGSFAWHDKVVIGNAINSIGKGKSLMDLSLWISVAGKIEQASDEAGFGKSKKTGKKIKQQLEDGQIQEIDQEIQNMPEFSVEIRNKEAELLWKELKELKFEDYVPQFQCRRCGSPIPNMPNIGTLVLMLGDIAECLGEKMPETEGDD